MLKKTIYRWIEKRFLSGCSNYNSLNVRKSCRSKKQAREVFAKNNIPHAKGQLFFSPWTAHKFAKQHGFPLVIKPNVSGFSRGSHFPITNFMQLWKAAFMVKIWWPTSVVEQYLLGKNYRVLAGNDAIISIIRRYPPYVTGDGRQTVAQLIDQENAIREKMKLYPTIHPIPKSHATRNYLKKQGMTLQSIPVDKQDVQLFNRISLAPGGIVETLPTDDLPLVNQELFISILKLFNANILGIDVIMEKGIETDYRAQKCIFLEVNSRPYVKMHEVPRRGEKQDLTTAFAKLDALTINDSDIF